MRAEDIRMVDDDPARLEKWKVFDLLWEAELENELIGNNTGARIGWQDLPSDPIFHRWLGEFCSRLPSYVKLYWCRIGNSHRAGYSYKGEDRSIKLEYDEFIERLSDIKPSPADAARILLEKFPVSR